MKSQTTFEYILFTTIAVLLALTATYGVVSLLTGIRDTAEVLERFSRHTGVSLNGVH